SIDCASYRSISPFRFDSENEKASLPRGSTRTPAALAALVPSPTREAVPLSGKRSRQNRAMPGRAELELLPEAARIEGSELTIGGVRASELADRFGTPLVVYCEGMLRGQARSFRQAVGESGRVVFGTKAFPNVAVLRLLRDEGIGADVATSGELAFALAAGFTGNELLVHGNNKDGEFLREAGGLDATVVLDAPAEAALAAGGAIP